MLPPILIRHQASISNILLQRRINHQLFSYRMPRQLPGEQVLVPRLLLSVCVRVDPAIVRLDLAVVVLDRVGDPRCTCYGGFR